MVDMVKTRLQNQTPHPTTGQLKYRNGLHCFRSILAEEGARGFYRGLPANLIGITPEKAIKLAVNDYTRYWFALRQYRTDMAHQQQQLNQHPGSHHKKIRFDIDAIPIWQGMLSGAFAGLCQVIVTNPMDVVKINSQMALIHARSLNPTARPQSSLEIVKELGLRGLYRGTPATLLRDVPFSFIFFPLSSVWKREVAERDRRQGGEGKVGIGQVFASGVVAGSVAAFSVTPADVIKTRLQTRRAPSSPTTDSATAKLNGQVKKGIRDVASEVYQTGGIKAFFRGGIQRVMIIAPLFGITLLVYEAQQRWFASSSKKS